jgi:DNA-binding GntR family transcriptional regulator
LSNPLIRAAKKPNPPPAGIVSITGDTANARAYALLKQAVLSGSFKPGEVVTLRALNELLGQGEMPAREAVKRLVSEGAFEALPNRSARAPVLDRREIKQLCDLRILLEANAAALAAGNITLHQIEELRGMNDGMVAAIANGDIPAYKSLNMAFHFAIYRIADNKPLANLIEALWLRMAPFISRSISSMTLAPGGFEQIANCHHEELIAAFQNRDPEAARVAMRLDLAAIHEAEGYWDAVAEQN